jgi:hypothetical protein
MTPALHVAIAVAALTAPVLARIAAQAWGAL